MTNSVIPLRINSVSPCATPPNEQLLSRKSLAVRWGCSIETLKRREASRVLTPIRFGPRMVRYALSEIIRVENHATGLAS